MTLRRRFFKWVAPIGWAGVVGYFAYYAIEGENGLLTLGQLETEIADARDRLTGLAAERERMEHRASLMNPDRIDPDMLDEQVRRLLNYSRPDEIVIHYGAR